MKERYKVISDRDHETVFAPDAVDYEAYLRRISPRKAAERMAAENSDIASGETLLAVRA